MPPIALEVSYGIDIFSLVLVGDDADILDGYTITLRRVASGMLSVSVKEKSHADGDRRWSDAMMSCRGIWWRWKGKRRTRQ